ncbi:hypothetical protein DYB36_004927 [Aphanomyces astaci]|uniref:Uncharacterized protein n=1 Tax=Aphanomyces astaci TaxID=112090 RepID=A0A397BUZ8_APHAT|nr:hypothetical protein DYB36_004927 [Aphanomyces astaci]
MPTNQASQHHGGHNGGDDFAADPLPFNYDVMEATFDDRYGGRNNNGGNVRTHAPPSSNDKPHHLPSQHPQQQQHPSRYGSLGMQHQQPQQQQQPYHDSYNESAPTSHHQYDVRRSEPHNAPMNDRPSNKTDSYHFMSQHASHPNDHDASARPPSSLHYSIPDLHSNMSSGHNGNNNLQPLYHQSSPGYSTNASLPPSLAQHSPYSTLMESHQSSINNSKKEMPPTYHGDYLDARPSHAPSSSHMSTSLASAQSPQEAVIKVKTSLKNKYWRNGRRNLQCFPSCKVFGDYSQIKIEDLKQHDFMWGKCRGSLIAEVTLNSNATFDDILLLGRVHSLENIPVPFDEAVIRECMIGRVVEPDVMDEMKEQWIQGERLPDFINPSQSVTCYEFKPKVWKYTDDMVHGKCKRRNVRYYVQFEAFVPVLSGDRRCFVCIGSGMSSSFEVGSSRVLARQKRKSKTGGDEDEDEKDSNEEYDQNDAGNSRRPAKRATNPANGYPI